MTVVRLAVLLVGPPPPSLGGIVITAAATARLRRLQRQSLEMCLAGVRGAHSAFGRRQLALGVDLSLELVEHRLARVGGSSGWVFGASPRFMGSDLSAQ